MRRVRRRQAPPDRAVRTQKHVLSVFLTPGLSLEVQKKLPDEKQGEMTRRGTPSSSVSAEQHGHPPEVSDGALPGPRLCHSVALGSPCSPRGRGRCRGGRGCAVCWLPPLTDLRGPIDFASVHPTLSPRRTQAPAGSFPL